ncbi:adenosylcobinamide-GDP ribazoletransferase [Tardiphaga sp.]|uniref:adenosylcobinamide-GDP ribazoletransferase n=1 Tax=Tardiphaga sp. TaxID=1926292 RepID=UPI002611C2C5|nr:adenosylcobinamide-GDP ribazoletransferase [Tardiphaga sp.]MDB5618887.1 cobalamin-5-phosphate synthase [Tardiphaga sp.]
MRIPADLINSVRFLTIVPMPDSVDPFAPDWMSRAMKYFPLVGAGIGLVSAIVLLIANEFWSPVIAALLAVIASVAITGAFHEDGLADTADSLGGYTIEKRLAIMKDSRIGTYGAVALGLGVALRVAAIADLPMWAGPAALIAAHAAARVTGMFVINRMNHAGDTATMKVSYVESKVRSGEQTFALVVVLLAALPLALISLTAVLTGLICGTVLAVMVTRWTRRALGGYTGDVLGATEQLFEIGFLLGVAAALS